MSSEVEAIEDKVRHHASRLETLTGDDNKRVRKRVLAALGKLKKELEQKKQKTGGDDDTDLKTVHPPNFDATTNSNAQSLTKKKLKNKVNLLNNEIKELAQKKCLKLAVKKFNWGVAKGYPVNVHTYTNLLNAYVRCVDMQGAEQLIAEMASKNLPLNVVVFTALLKGYAETGNLHEMTSIVFQRMPDASVDLNIRTVHTFLRGCVRIGAVESGLKLSEHAVVCGTKLDWSSISSLVQLLSQSLSVDKAEEVLERHITESDSEVSLFHKCMGFMHLASAYLLKGDYHGASKYSDQASALYAECKSSRLRGNMMRHMSAAVVEELDASALLFQEHQLDEAGILLESMQSLLQRYALTIGDFEREMGARYMSQLSRLFVLGADGRGDLESSQSRSDGDNTELGRAELLANSVQAVVEKFGLNRVKIEGSKGGRKAVASRIMSSFLPSLCLDFDRIFQPASTDEGESSQVNGVVLKVELCSGDGDWIVAQAAKDSRSRWVAIELRCSRISGTATKAVLNNVTNLCLVSGDANHILPSRLPADCVAHLFVNHPEPPERQAGKGTNQGKHLLTTPFFKHMHRVLQVQGSLTILSDNLQYMTELTSQVSSELSTEFESGPFDVAESPAKVETLVGTITLWRGELPRETGVAVEASSYFDRMWDRGNKKRRWFLFLLKRAS